MTASPQHPSGPTAPSPPAVVVAGTATPEEVAALLAVLSLVGAGHHGVPEHARSPWADPARVLGAPATRPGGWRTSALPR
ncbi:MAG: acyl-CoA carboxylase subunit epsilon [Humibacillus sp.]|nr:acyl-CoA carboxylase subunit epsilon [Humibacillus sp.]